MRLDKLLKVIRKNTRIYISTDRTGVFLYKGKRKNFYISNKGIPLNGYKVIEINNTIDATKDEDEASCIGIIVKQVCKKTYYDCDIEDSYPMIKENINKRIPKPKEPPKEPIKPPETTRPLPIHVEVPGKGMRTERGGCTIPPAGGYRDIHGKLHR